MATETAHRRPSELPTHGHDFCPGWGPPPAVAWAGHCLGADSPTPGLSPQLVEARLVASSPRLTERWITTGK